MSFSRRLSVAVLDVAEHPLQIKPNQILIQEHLYDRLFAILTPNDRGLIMLKISSDANADITLQYVTAVAPHNNPTAQVLIPQTLIDLLGGDTHYRFTKIKPLPDMTSITIKVHNNDFCFGDIRTSIQLYLENYHILHKDMQFEVPTDVDAMTATVSIENIEPADICRVPNGEVELDLITKVDENESEGSAPAPAPAPVPTNIPIADEPQRTNNIIDTPQAWPKSVQDIYKFDTFTAQPETPQEQIPAPVELSKEEVRRRRIAAFEKRFSQ